jgi:hypothetical protein
MLNFNGVPQFETQMLLIDCRHIIHRNASRSHQSKEHQEGPIDTTNESSRSHPASFFSSPGLDGFASSVAAVDSEAALLSVPAVLLVLGAAATCLYLTMLIKYAPKSPAPSTPPSLESSSSASRMSLVERCQHLSHTNASANTALTSPSLTLSSLAPAQKPCSTALDSSRTPARQSSSPSDLASTCSAPFATSTSP